MLAQGYNHWFLVLMITTLIELLGTNQVQVFKFSGVQRRFSFILPQKEGVEVSSSLDVIQTQTIKNGFWRSLLEDC